jgi:hypothetical protein
MPNHCCNLTPWAGNAKVVAREDLKSKAILKHGGRTAISAGTALEKDIGREFRSAQK